MQTFLDKVAQWVYQKHSDQLDSIALVFPNQRAHVFFRNSLHQLSQKSIWSPELYTIEDFIVGLTPYNVPEQIDVLFELYAVHRNIEQADSEAIDRFIYWGTTLLQDFEEIDRNLVDATALYSFLTEAKALESWNLEAEPLTPFQLRYLAFWRQMADYYHQLKERLSAKGLAYQGMAYQHAADHFKPDSVPYQHIYFVGLNALTKAEQLIIQGLEEAGKASTLWDTDHYYVDDPLQEAGIFIREAIQREPTPFLWTEKHLSERAININISGISGNVEQAKYSGELLTQLSREGELEQTALVLADENLLSPVLQSIPASIEKVNVTMGLSLSTTVVYTFFDSIFQLFIGIEKLKKSHGEARIYHKDLRQLQAQPLLQSAVRGLFNDSQDNPIEDLLEEQKTFYPLSALQSLKSHPLAFLFKKEVADSHTFATLQLQLIDQLKQLLQAHNESAHTLYLEYLFRFSTIFNRLSDLLAEQNFKIELSSLRLFFRQICQNSKVPFLGEPLQGLQLMGMLETRTLDFKRIIMLSVNEGILPAGKMDNSFIPYDIRRKVGLPTHTEKDATFAYHFYRLLQRAEDVHLLYNNQADVLKGGERSRFLEQLIHELPIANPNVKLHHQQISSPLVASQKHHTSIKSSTEIQQAIIQHLQNGISPSALSTYIRCPMDYYYRYVLRLPQQEETEEIIEMNSFGEMIHNSLELLYQPYIHQQLDLEKLQSIQKQAEQVLQAQFEQRFEQHFRYGKNLIIYQIAQDYLQRFLQMEQKWLENSDQSPKILALESTLSADIAVDLPKLPFIRLKGKADRIDLLGDTIRIIDYKTGKVLAHELKFRSTEELFESTNRSKALQVLLYLLMFPHEPSLKHQAGIISMRNISQGFMPAFASENLSSNELLESLKAELRTIVSKMIDPEFIFEHEPSSTYCSYCE